MKRIKFILLALVTTLFFNACSSKKQLLSVNKSSKAKNTQFVLPGVQTIPIKDSNTNRAYELYIKLPEGYSANKNKNYPVLYFTDVMWHIEVLSGAADYLLDDVILVGISWEKNFKGRSGNLGAHASRYRDYTMEESTKKEVQDKYQYGQANNHLSFIQNDVIKYIEKNYKADPEKRSYFGYSIGAKFGAFILLKQPQTFKNYILGSPYFKSNLSYFSKLDSIALLQHKNMNVNVAISYGSLEKKLGANAEAFIKMLKKSNHKGLSLQKTVIPGSHKTAFPMSTVNGITWLSKMNTLLNKGHYFGQKPPGLIPEIFAPGIVSIDGRYEHGISFSPNLDEVYFSANKKDEDPSIYFSKLKGEKWTNPKKANFTKGLKAGEMHPFINPTGDQIFFTAHDEFTLPEHKESVKIWTVNRLENSWSNAKQLDSPVNDDFVFYLNQAKNGDLYYFNLSKRKTYYAPNKNGKYPEVYPVKIGGAHAFISPSQDYIVVNARNKKDAQRKSDIYVYFKEKDGTWSKAINLGKEINSNFAETCPSITPDGKYLFFGRYNEAGGLSNFYWASTEVISKLKTAYFKKSK